MSITVVERAAAATAALLLPAAAAARSAPAARRATLAAPGERCLAACEGPASRGAAGRGAAVRRDDRATRDRYAGPATAHEPRCGAVPRGLRADIARLARVADLGRIAA